MKNENNNNLKKNYKKEKSSFYQYNKKIIPSIKKEIIGYCFICKTGISNEAYSFKFKEDLIHFECCIKTIKEKYVNRLNYPKKFKVTYLGSQTFAIYIEKGVSQEWEIVQKITLKDLFDPEKS